MEDKHLKKILIIDAEKITNKTTMEVENMTRNVQIDSRTWRVWGLYGAILNYFSLASNAMVCLSETFVDCKTFAANNECDDAPVVDDEDFEKVMTVLSSLPEREKVVLVLRFGLDNGTPKSLEEVGRIQNVTRERIRQLEAKALRKMRTPGCLCKLPALFGFVPPAEPGSEVENIDADTDILNLGLSVRAYNCLKRFACINTVGDILNYPKGDWSKIKNLGRRATLEIQEKMRAVGYPDFSNTLS